MMKLKNTTMRRVSAGALLGAAAAALVAAPTASAAPNCHPDAVAGTVSAVTGAASAYLNAHPGANQVVQAARTLPRAEAAAGIRAYFTANSQEYYELRDILAPIGDTQRQCNVALLSPELASAYAEFMAG
jgi:heme-binding protein